MNAIFMEIDKEVIYSNVQYSTWNDERILYTYIKSLNLSSYNLNSFNIWNNSSFDQLNDAHDAHDINATHDINDAMMQ
jgi:hypothetical protein